VLGCMSDKCYRSGAWANYGNGLPPEAAEGGRGLFLVAALSERWSCYRLSQGKVVWSEIVQ
jgi:hypothetical protein